jgi:hypothetical protein
MWPLIRIVARSSKQLLKMARSTRAPRAIDERLDWIIGEWPLCANSGRTERISLDSANARPTDSTANPRENVTQSIAAKDAHDLRYIFVNRAAEKLFGMPPSGEYWKIGA